MRPSVRSFFRTPKGLVIIILLIFIFFAAPGQDLRAVLKGLAGATAAAGLMDFLILRFRKKRWEFPDGAIITGLIVAMVLSSQEPWYITAAVSVIGVLSKYLLRSRRANVFNPAAFAMVAGFYLFHTGQSWWGAMTDVPFVSKLIMVGLGFFIADRVNKMPLVLSFLAAYFSLCTVTAFVGDTLQVAEIFRSPDVEATLFFAFIHHPHRPAHIPQHLSGSSGIRSDHGGRQLCVFPNCRRGLLSPGGDSDRQSVGGLAACKPPDRLHVSSRTRHFSP
jgi:Na+-translocating ferredoxin:NAD+ oxidoreductase RnfD subunit